MSDNARTVSTVVAAGLRQDGTSWAKYRWNYGKWFGCWKNT